MLCLVSQCKSPCTYHSHVKVTIGVFFLMQMCAKISNPAYNEWGSSKLLLSLSYLSLILGTSLSFQGEIVWNVCKITELKKKISSVPRKDPETSQSPQLALLILLILDGRCEIRQLNGSTSEKSSYLWSSSVGLVSLNNSLFICVSVWTSAVGENSRMEKSLFFGMLFKQMPNRALAAAEYWALMKIQPFPWVLNKGKPCCWLA